jgi:hypothetical protein
VGIPARPISYPRNAHPALEDDLNGVTQT